MTDPISTPAQQLAQLVARNASDEEMTAWCDALGPQLRAMEAPWDAVVEYWFGEAGASWHPRYRGPSELWFRATPEIDAEIMTRFGELHEAAASGSLDAWASQPRGVLALVLLLDQFPRHMFRGRARMFATDAQARAFAERALEPDMVGFLSPPQQAFAWMCLEHAEDVDLVARSIAGLDNLCRDPATRRSRRFYKNLLRSARQHQDLLVRHGRYPHRNALLGRVSTPAERAWLSQVNKPRFAKSVDIPDVAPLKLLVLHSFRQSGARLASRMKGVRDGLAGLAELVYADAPHPYVPTDRTRAELTEDFGTDLEDLGDQSHQRCWWNSGADHSSYEGWDASLAYLRRVIETQGPFDGVLGFSQGAAAAGLLAASGADLRFAICISGFASRAEEHAALMQPGSVELPSLHIYGEQDVLVDNDRSRALAACFLNARVATHAGGHFVPMHWPLGEIRDFLLAHARPAEACSLAERIRYAKNFDRPLGLGDAGRELWHAIHTDDGAELPALVAAAIDLGQSRTLDDVQVIAWALQRDYDARFAEGILAPAPGDEFHRLMLAALCIAPDAVVAWVDDIPRHGGWKLLTRLAVFAKIATASDATAALYARIVERFATQLTRERDLDEPLSDCAIAAPRTQSATQRVSGLAGDLATRLFPTMERVAAYVAYTRLLSELSQRYRGLHAHVPSQRAERRNTALEWEDDALGAPISEEVLRPRPVPVKPCPPEELEPLIAHLDDNAPVDEATQFTRGTHMPDGRLDLCKQVVGPEGIGPVLDAVADNPFVTNFMIGNNIVGNSGAQAIADFIQGGRSHIDVWYIGGNEIDAQGLAPICEALYEHPHVQSLWLKRNPLGPRSGALLAELLRRNDRIHTLDLVNTGLLDEGLRVLAEALVDNRGLRHLYVGTNGLGVESARVLADVLRTNDRLQSLYISCNRLGDEGATVLADALRGNGSLRRLSLASNRLGPAGAEALADALAADTCGLQFLGLGWTRATAAVGELGNRIGNEGAASLAQMLRVNRSLRALDVSHNRISQAGIDAIDEALDVNRTLCLLRHPQHGKAVNHDSLERLHAKLERNWQTLQKQEADVTQEDLTTPRSTQAILSVYRTA